MTELGRFLNALRILRSIDQHDLEAAGVFKWVEFRDSPLWWMMTASDEDAAKVWAIVERRQPKPSAA